MKNFLLELDQTSGESLYLQLFRALRDAILRGDIAAGERLPSLREIARRLGISVTTAQAAYDQLQIEGYITSRPQSGFYAAEIGSARAAAEEQTRLEPLAFADVGTTRYRTDISAFDFVKWKKCVAKILNEYPEQLLTGADRQGEPFLRSEIARYVYSARGVTCTPDQIVVSAGTQQLMSHLSRILREMGIDMVCTEDPGYLPVQKIFQDQGFAVHRIPMREDGIRIEQLPENVPAAVYIIPSNQFPTGSVMPAGRRYQLLEWAKANASVIIEDDYDSELRYFGNPVPALQGLDRDSSVVYLGSFTSTLFAAVRISFMVLPKPMAEIFETIREDYDQTSSKTEQLTLALYMHNGWYRTHVRKLRALYAQKLRRAAAALKKYGEGFIEPVNTSSGMVILLRVKSSLPPEELSRRALALRLNARPVSVYTGETAEEAAGAALSFSYNQIPLEEIDEAIRDLAEAWRA